MRLVRLDLALLALMILASRFALVLHEVGGHAVPAMILGSRRVEIRLSPLGGGYVSPDFPARPSTAALAIFDLGGIVLNLLTGAAAWMAARRRIARDLLHAALLFFGVGSIAGALAYLSNGIYYGSGDPVGLAPSTENIAHLQFLWPAFLPAAAAVGWFAVRHHLDFVSGHLPTGTARLRIGAMVLTAGVVALCYGGLWWTLRNPQIEGSTRTWRLEQEIARETERRIEAQKAVPPLPTPPAADPTPSIPPRPLPAPIVRPEEVAHRIPSPLGPLMLYGAFAVAGLAALLRPRTPSPAAEPVRPAVAFGLAVLAAVLVAGFAWAG